MLYIYLNEQAYTHTHLWSVQGTEKPVNNIYLAGSCLTVIYGAIPGSQRENNMSCAKNRTAIIEM